MKKIFAFLFFVAFMFAFCEPSWSEDVFVKVVDHYSRALENATVQIYFQMDYGGIESEGIYGLANMTTKSDGMAMVRLKNNQWYRPKLDCTYDIFVNYKGEEMEMRDVEVGRHASVLTFVFENVYLLTVKTMDENGNPLPSTVIANGEKKTAENGVVSFSVVKGAVDITILYAGGQRSAKIWVDDDRVFEISVLRSNITITALDDSGEGMECIFQLEKNNYSFSKTLVMETAKGTYYGKVVCGGKEKELDIDMTKQESYFVVFDLRAPVVKNISVEKNGTVLVINAEDPGKGATGIAEVWVVYPGDRTRYPLFKEKSGLYKAVLKEGTKNFVVFLKDNEGNIRSVEGVIETLERGMGEEKENGEDWGPFVGIMVFILVILIGVLGKVIYDQTKNK